MNQKQLQTAVVAFLGLSLLCDFLFIWLLLKAFEVV